VEEEGENNGREEAEGKEGKGKREIKRITAGVAGVSVEA
jgi:hypothetical protein